MHPTTGQEVLKCPLPVFSGQHHHGCFIYVPPLVLFIYSPRLARSEGPDQDPSRLHRRFYAIPSNRIHMSSEIIRPVLWVPAQSRAATDIFSLIGSAHDRYLYSSTIYTGSKYALALGLPSRGLCGGWSMIDDPFNIPMFFVTTSSRTLSD
jgi:hypothetical protein